MQNESYEVIKDKIKKALKEHSKDRIGLDNSKEWYDTADMDVF